ncbi:hypothetical protein EGT67_21955 [Prescottella agglutinans]|uniref:Uncharacterized protein n=1 Tax=Prescottella agglutinans TaxID=1644129 RepID=A0A3S3E7N6_9NOCA|nr:hypothetical protein EGT67_21955 [Prescottella agglutinans]
MPATDGSDWRQWSFHCTCCDHSFRAAARTQAAAESAARTNGWTLRPAPRCPGCLTALASIDGSGSTTGVA